MCAHTVGVHALYAHDSCHCVCELCIQRGARNTRCNIGVLRTPGRERLLAIHIDSSINVVVYSDSDDGRLRRHHPNYDPRCLLHHQNCILNWLVTGKVFASIACVIGVLVVALPVSVLGANFSTKMVF